MPANRYEFLALDKQECAMVVALLREWNLKQDVIIEAMNNVVVWMLRVVQLKAQQEVYQAPVSLIFDKFNPPSPKTQVASGIAVTDKNRFLVSKQFNQKQASSLTSSHYRAVPTATSKIASKAGNSHPPVARTQFFRPCIAATTNAITQLIILLLVLLILLVLQQRSEQLSQLATPRINI